MYELTKKDWKLFRSRLPEWQEAYIDRLNHEYIALLTTAENPSAKFWKLNERIKEDKHRVGVVAEMSRSKMLYNIMALIHDDVIGPDDLIGFSDEFRERILLVMRDQEEWNRNAASLEL